MMMYFLSKNGINKRVIDNSTALANDNFNRIILILLLLSINFDSFVSAADTSCVEDLMSLIDSFSSNKTSTDNILRIQETFYPQNKAAAHYVIVGYCFQEPCNKTNNADYIYIWTDNAIFFVVDYYLFSTLTFFLADLGDIGEVFFVIPEPCNNNTEDLLLALTSQVEL